MHEHENGLFFKNHPRPPVDPLFARLLTYPNVLVTGHQAFLTRDALLSIAAVTRQNPDGWASGRPAVNELKLVP